MVFNGVILACMGRCSLLLAPTDSHGIVEVRLDHPIPPLPFEPLYTQVLVEDEVWDSEARCFVHCKISLDKVLGEGMFSQEG